MSEQQKTETDHTPKARGDDPGVHFIRSGRFVCTAPPTARCRNYPGCECEEWSAELHGVIPAEGHADRPQDECWIDPWMGATDLSDTYSADDVLCDDDAFPDGAITVEWEFDYLTWEYADPSTRPAQPTPTPHAQPRDHETGASA